MQILVKVFFNNSELMKLIKYEFNNKFFLVYSLIEKDFDVKEMFKVVDSNPNIKDNLNIDILNYEQLVYRLTHQKFRTNDVKLQEYKINSCNDLYLEYSKINIKKSKLPSNIRKIVIEKYLDTLKFISNTENITK